MEGGETDMGIEDNDTPPERIDLSAVRSIEPAHRGADDATGNDQSRVDLPSARSSDAVSHGADDDATGNDQSRIELGTSEGGNPSAAEQRPAPTVTEFGEMMKAREELGPRDTPPPPLREFAEPQGPNDTPPPVDPEIAETSARIYEPEKLVAKTAEGFNEAADLAKNVRDVVTFAGPIVGAAATYFTEHFTHFFGH